MSHTKSENFCKPSHDLTLLAHSLEGKKQGIFIPKWQELFRHSAEKAQLSRYANCDIDFNLTKHHSRQARNDVIAVLKSLCFGFYELVRAATHAKRYKQVKEKMREIEPRKYLKCLPASLPVAVFPYGLSLVHMLSLLTTAPFTKELLSKL